MFFASGSQSFGVSASTSILPMNIQDLFPLGLTARRSNQLILKEISPECLIGRTDVEAETPILWPPDAKSRLTGKDPDYGKDRRQEEKGTTEDEMAGWHH